MQFLFILTLLFAVLVATFALQNANPVTIYFLNWQFEASFGLVILICILIGAVALGSLGLVHQASSKLKTRNDGKTGKKGIFKLGGRDEQCEKSETNLVAEPVPEKAGNQQAPNHQGTVKEPGGVEDSPQEVED
ncbi:MAG TPA: hypothetical protein DDZ55_01070 [Firmicutes bacterium]|nr:hypothetical protein [Bacillota bacterium]